MNKFDALLFVLLFVCITGATLATVYLSPGGSPCSCSEKGAP